MNAFPAATFKAYKVSKNSHFSPEWLQSSPPPLGNPAAHFTNYWCVCVSSDTHTPVVQMQNKRSSNKVNIWGKGGEEMKKKMSASLLPDSTILCCSTIVLKNKFSKIHIKLYVLEYGWQQSEKAVIFFWRFWKCKKLTFTKVKVGCSKAWHTLMFLIFSCYFSSTVKVGFSKVRKKSLLSWGQL